MRRRALLFMMAVIFALTVASGMALAATIECSYGTRVNRYMTNALHTRGWLKRQANRCVEAALAKPLLRLGSVPMR
jgi:hypothetical protein